MKSADPRSPGKPHLGDYVMWLLVGATMLFLLDLLVHTSDSPVAWVLLAPMVPVGGWLIWRRWRFVRDGIPHV